MAFSPKPNTGTLFKNDNKQSDRDPWYKGSALVDGVEYWVDAWVNEIKSGENKGRKYLSLKYKPKDQQSGGLSSGDTKSSVDEEPF